VKCPHCQRDVKYKERSDHTCSKCQRRFALEPRDNPAKLSDDRLVRLVHKLSDGGTLLVPDDLLRHFAARKIATPRIRGKVQAIVLLPVMLYGGPIFAKLELYWAIALTVVLFVATVVYALVAPALPFPASALVSAAAFRAHLRPYAELHGGFPPGLVMYEQIRARPIPARLGPLRAVVAAPSRAVIDCLRINGVAERLEIGLLCLGDALDADRPAVVQRLRARPGLPVLLLHDASPGGCLLARDLPAKLGLQDGHRILDMGLFPKRSMLKKRLCLRRPVARGELQRLRARPALPAPGPGAPVRAMRPRRAELSEAELAWLASGATTPVEALRPADLIRRVELAVARLVPSPEVAARRLGFMSRPA
jgi:hypothetical protein